MVFRLVFQAVTFSRTKSILNLSRTDPTKISTGFGSQTYFHASGSTGPLTFVSTVKVGSCHLINAKLNSGNGRFQKQIEGACIEGEWERMVGAIGQVIGKVEYKSQINGGYMSFATALSSTDSGMWHNRCLTHVIVHHHTSFDQ